MTKRNKLEIARINANQSIDFFRMKICDLEKIGSIELRANNTGSLGYKNLYFDNEDIGMVLMNVETNEPEEYANIHLQYMPNICVLCIAYEKERLKILRKEV
ncbi:MAG: hypothetical protein LBU89_09360 [Fibromonadaceae bacterium]|nr:hypothetical protein [Fibromonadaceae bacterium]